MLIKCYNKTHNKALRDGNLKGLLINNSLSGVIMTASNNTRNIERGQSRGTKLIYGVGFNSDRGYKSWDCGRHSSAYQTWFNMLMRCYKNLKSQKNKSYFDCVVAKEWHDYQNFADWFYSQKNSNSNYHLDKDILSKGSKIYSPNTCCLVPRELNSLLIDSVSRRGAYPRGVSLFKKNNRFIGRLSINGSDKHLGYFSTPEEAHQAYKAAKEAHVKKKALEWQDRIDQNVFDALMSWTVDN